MRCPALLGSARDGFAYLNRALLTKWRVHEWTPQLSAYTKPGVPGNGGHAKIRINDRHAQSLITGHDLLIRSNAERRRARRIGRSD